MMHKIIAWLIDHPLIRERDQDGTLLAAGFKWTEPVPWVLPMFGTGALVLYFYALGCGVDPRTPRAFTFMVGAAACACVVICILCGSVDRGIAFRLNGEVSLRGGIVNWLELVGSFKDHADIVSIETTKTEQGFGIAVYTKWGGTIMLSTALKEPRARLVAVQLTHALRERRETMTSIGRWQQRRDAPASQPRARAWID